MDRRAFLSSAAAAALIGYISSGQAAKAAPLG
ncbi:ABC transporter substrate-binding protein, partial [Pseudoxanthomonas sp. KAs_5_3]